MDNLDKYVGWLIIGAIVLISWAFKAIKKSQQQQTQQRRPAPKESTAGAPPQRSAKIQFSPSQMPTEMQIAMQEIFAPEEHEEDEVPEEATEAIEPEPEPAPVEAPEEKPAPPAEEKSPEEMRKKFTEILGMPLNPQNIRYGIIFSEILKRPTPRRLRDE